MGINARYVITQAAEVLQDRTFVRWTVPEMVRYFNDGCLEVLVPRPDATATTTTLELVAGVRQSVGPGFVKLLDIRRNATGFRSAVKQCSMELLDAVEPQWATREPESTVRHFMYDPRVPKEFHVYPPVLAGTQVEAVCSALPTVVPEPAPPAGIEAVNTVSNLPSVMTNALINYVLYRAYAKDSESPSNVERARAYYDAFASSLGTEVSATVTAGPTTRSTPMSSS